MDQFYPFLQALAQNALDAAALFLITTVVAFVGLNVRNALTWVKAHTTSTQLQALIDVANMAVTAAEQSGLAVTGAQKKDAALATITSTLATRGLHFDAAAIDAALESAVYNQINYAKLPAANTVPAQLIADGAAVATEAGVPVNLVLDGEVLATIVARAAVNKSIA
jgi:hypothetical protein